MTIPIVPQDNLDLALDLAFIGWAVFPTREKPGIPYKNKDGEMITPGTKSPYTHSGMKDATQDESEVRAMWRHWPGALVGINCAASGIFAVDLDVGHAGGIDGRDSFTRLIQTRGGGAVIPCGPVQITPSGGQHWIWNMPSGGVHVPNNAGKLARGIDLRSNGYICTGILADGRSYQWVPGHDYMCPTCAAPGWLIDCIDSLTRKDLPPEVKTSTTEKNTLDFVTYFFDKYLAQATPGNRHDAELGLALQLRDNGLSESAAERILAIFSDKLGCDKIQCERIVKNVYEKSPRDPYIMAATR